MTFDSALLYRSTESLILPSKRRFFPFKIPNFHQQLRHYISTSDPDRIYVVVDRVVYAIHISSQKREGLAVIPFEPKCLAAGCGWIAVGGSDNGECAFIKLGSNHGRAAGARSSSQRSDVDSALPIDLEQRASRLGSRVPSPWSGNDEGETGRTSSRLQLPEVQLHKFGGSIVNSVTIHRLPGGEGLADEDVVVVSNNDRTVTIYSLTRSKTLEVIHHPACMNFATISPDCKVLAAVGDENHAYFYEISRDMENPVIFSDNVLTEWNWTLLRCLELQISTRFDDGCCFTIAFSPSSHLCAVGSQSGIISIFDVRAIRESKDEKQDVDPTLCLFRSSRSYFDGGAVRCMTFSPAPWDLLVWVEDQGRAGVADVRQAFSRRQILTLDANEPGLQQVQTENISPATASGELSSDPDSSDTPRPGDEMDNMQRAMLDLIEGSSGERHTAGSDRQALRENLIEDLTERERQIIEFLNTARWSSRLEENLGERPLRMTLHPRSRSRPGGHGSTDVANRSTSPLRYSDTLQEFFRESYLGRSDNSLQPRRQGSVVLSQGNAAQAAHSSDATTSSAEVQPTITLSWTASPSEIQASPADAARGPQPTSLTADSVAGTTNNTRGDSQAHTTSRSGLLTDSRERSQRSSSIPRRSERLDTSVENRFEPSRLLTAELRANVAAERLRRQRQVPGESSSRAGHWDQRYRQQFMGFDNSRSPRWIRHILNDLPDRNPSNQEPGGTAGVGWGADGRTLYVATVEGIFEYQLNVHDRKTFPVFSYR
ncbi:hypothetical protein DTO166G5_4022 [Paecilomyces variotii]|nr:hypothetical protein DTO166G5_4022 [Paecilomyces variotii]KAJ9380659.1 hypothetical protein DTO063F5_6621 [Paecilomyces variotii]